MLAWHYMMSALGHELTSTWVVCDVRWTPKTVSARLDLVIDEGDGSA